MLERRLRGRAEVEAVQDRVPRHRRLGLGRLRESLADALEQFHRARRLAGQHQAARLAEQRARGPLRFRVVGGHLAEAEDRLGVAVRQPQRLAGVVHRRRHGVGSREQARDPVVAGDGGLDVGRRAALRQDDAAGQHEPHRPALGVPVLLLQQVDRRLRGGDVARDVELVLGDAQERGVRHAALLVGIDHRLEVLQRLGVLLLGEERQAALVPPARGALGRGVLRPRERRAGSQHEADRRSPPSRMRAFLMSSFISSPGPCWSRPRRSRTSAAWSARRT